jgi:putative heme degradation protein
MKKSKPKLPKKGAGRRLSERLTDLSKQPPTQALVDKINADEDRALKEQKAQDWVVANVDSAPDTPSFEEVWIAGYEQGDRDAVVRSMEFIERQGVKLSNAEYELHLAESTNRKLLDKIQQQANEIDRLRTALGR